MKKTALQQLIEKFEEEFRFCQDQVAKNIEAKEYLVAHNHSVRQEQTYGLLKLALEHLATEKQDIETTFADGVVEGFAYGKSGEQRVFPKQYYTETFLNNDVQNK